MKYLDKIFIGKKKISNDNASFIIAEIGINHEGKFNHCINLIKKAKLAGADAVKFQFAKAEENYLSKTRSYLLYNKTELTISQIKKIYEFAKKLKITCFATMDNFYLDKLKTIKQDLYKISSSQINDLDLIKKVLSKNKPV